MTAFWQGPEPWSAFQPARREPERLESRRSNATTAPPAQPVPQRDSARDVEFVQHAIQHAYNR